MFLCKTEHQTAGFVDILFYLFIYFIKRLINSVSPVAACPREGVLPRLKPDCAGVGRQAEPGHVAGGLAL